MRVPRGMGHLAKTPRPLAPARRTSQSLEAMMVGALIELMQGDAELSCEVFPFLITRVGPRLDVVRLMRLPSNVRMRENMIQVAVMCFQSPMFVLYSMHKKEFWKKNRGPMM